jgi:hypothetical protein
MYKTKKTESAIDLNKIINSIIHSEADEYQKKNIEKALGYNLIQTEAEILNLIANLYNNSSRDKYDFIQGKSKFYNLVNKNYSHHYNFVYTFHKNGDFDFIPKISKIYGKDMIFGTYARKDTTLAEIPDKISTKITSLEDFFDKIKSKSSDGVVDFILKTDFLYDLYFGLEIDKKITNNSLYFNDKKLDFDFFEIRRKTPVDGLNIIYNRDNMRIINEIKIKTVENNLFEIANLVTLFIINNKINLYIPQFKNTNLPNLCFIMILMYGSIEFKIAFFSIRKIIKMLNLFSEVNKIYSSRQIIEYYKTGKLNEYYDLIEKKSDELIVKIPCYFYNNTIFFKQEDFDIKKKITIYI